MNITGKYDLPMGEAGHGIWWVLFRASSGFYGPGTIIMALLDQRVQAKRLLALSKRHTFSHWGVPIEPQASYRPWKMRPLGNSCFLIWEQMRDWKISGTPHCPILWTRGFSHNSYFVSQIPTKQRGKVYIVIAFGFLNHLLYHFQLFQEFQVLGHLE